MDAAIESKSTAAKRNYLAGAFDQAEQQCREVLSLDPDNTETTGLLGLISYARGDLVAAESLLRKSLNDHPDSAGWLNLGSILARKGGWSEAEACYRKAITLRDSYWQAHRNLGFLLLRQQKRQEACAEFRRSIEINPKDAQSAVILGKTLYELGEMEEAVKVNASAIE